LEDGTRRLADLCGLDLRATRAQISKTTKGELPKRIPLATAAAETQRDRARLRPVDYSALAEAAA
jgi:hypothetical protein